MWSSYTKTFVFRDCFDKTVLDGDIEAINILLKKIQKNNDREEIGSYLHTSSLSVSKPATSIGYYEMEDTGEKVLCFYYSDIEIATVFIPCNGEIHLSFEVEEEIKTGDFVIHGCEIKEFNGNQI